MTRVVAVGSFAVLAGSVGVGMAYGAAAPKVTICHLPPGNPTNVQLITVGAPAVAQHVAQHGDAVCPEGDRDCCVDDDGAVCTNLESDVNNCGSCGTACDTGGACIDGECVGPNTLDLSCTCMDADGNVCRAVSVSPCGTSCPPTGATSELCAIACRTSECPISVVSACVETFTDTCASQP